MTVDKLVKIRREVEWETRNRITRSRIRDLHGQPEFCQEEGKDYQDLEDLQLLGPGNTELPNQGRIRSNKNAAIRGSGESRIRSIYHTRRQGRKSWDMLIGTTYQLTSGEQQFSLKKIRNR